MKTKQT